MSPSRNVAGCLLQKVGKGGEGAYLEGGGGLLVRGTEGREGRREETGNEGKEIPAKIKVRAVLTNGHTGHVPRAPGFFFFLRGPLLAINAANFLP